MPRFDFAQRRGGTPKDSQNQTSHDSQQRAVLPPRRHADAAGEAVDAVKIQQVGREDVRKRHQWRREHA